MKILLIDTLNIMMSKFPIFWTRSFAVMRNELEFLAHAAEMSGFKPIFVLDLYRAVHQGQQKWRRRQKKLYLRNRAIPCSASCLLGTILAETDILWTYAVDMEADDLIIQIAQSLPGSTILSGDKGYLRVLRRNYCVARYYCVQSGLLTLNTIDHCSDCTCNTHANTPCIKFHQNISKVSFYIDELLTKRTMSKGVFYPSFGILPCCWCFLKPLRKHFYANIGIPTVRESHVCASICHRSGQLTWDTEDVYADSLQGVFEETCQSYVLQFEKISKNCIHRSYPDHANAVFACAVSCAQLLTDLTFYKRTAFTFLDDLVVSRKFNTYLNHLLSKTSACNNLRNEHGDDNERTSVDRWR